MGDTHRLDDQRAPAAAAATGCCVAAPAAVHRDQRFLAQDNRPDRPQLERPTTCTPGADPIPALPTGTAAATNHVDVGIRKVVDRNTRVTGKGTVVVPVSPGGRVAGSTATHLATPQAVPGLANGTTITAGSTAQRSLTAVESATRAGLHVTVGCRHHQLAVNPYIGLAQECDRILAGKVDRDRRAQVQVLKREDSHILLGIGWHQGTGRLNRPGDLQRIAVHRECTLGQVDRRIGRKEVGVKENTLLNRQYRQHPDRKHPLDAQPGAVRGGDPHRVFRLHFMIENGIGNQPVLHDGKLGIVRCALAG